MMEGRTPVPSTGRRRFLHLFAAGAAMLMPRAAGAARRHGTVEWTGIALGAEAGITLVADDRTAANRALAAVLAEVERLESEFSLFVHGSAIDRLNRSGRLDAPSLDMLRILRLSRRVAEITGGAFDPSIQPLWRVVADHFATRSTADGRGFEFRIAEARQRVGLRRIGISPRSIRLDDGMALTFNGIAQGYITDRAAGILRQHGFGNVLIDLGEIAAIGRRADGAPWSVGIRDPWDPVGLAHRIPMADTAAATSAPYGLTFDEAGRWSHLLSPDGKPVAKAAASVTVIHPSAAVADAFSTALAVMPATRARMLAAGLRGIETVLVGPEGKVERFGNRG